MTTSAGLLRKIALGEDSRRHFMRDADYIALEPWNLNRQHSIFMV